MIRHPVILVIGLLDLIAWGIYLAAAWRVLAALPGFRPAESGAVQLRRERDLELAAYQAPWVMALQVLALLLLVIGISNLWTVCVPGAMCGTGVLQAMGGPGVQTLIFRGLALVVLYCGRAADRLGRSAAADPLFAPVHGRLLLLAAPLMLWGSWTFIRSAAALSGPAPVSCCAVVYDRAVAGWLEGAAPALSAGVWAAAGFGGALLTAAWGALQYRRPRLGGRAGAAAALAGILAWGAAAVMMLKSVVAPYLFEVLYHPCPWCFFLWDHHALGFVLFGLPGWIAAECAAALTVRGMVHLGGWSEPAQARLARSGCLLAAGALLFAALAASPVLLWRLRFGGWIS